MICDVCKTEVKFRHYDQRECVSAARVDERRKLLKDLRSRLGSGFPLGWECCHGVSLGQACEDCNAGPIVMEAE